MKRWLLLYVSLSLIMIAVTLPSFSQIIPAPPAAIPVNTVDPSVTPATKIIPGCKIMLTVVDEAALSGEFLIDAEGKIHFTLMDEDGANKQTWTADVAGKTAEEAVHTITDSLKQYIKEPLVQLYIVRMPRLHIELHGPAKNTGKLELPLKSHLSDALISAQYTSRADLANIYIMRSPPPDPQNKTSKIKMIYVDFTAFQRGESDNDPLLEEGDVVRVALAPEVKAGTELKYVRIVGEVGREVSIPVSAGISVKDALDRAGGLKVTADRTRLMLIRGIDGKILNLEADKIDSNDPVHNLTMLQGDLLIVGVRDRGQQYAVLGEVAEEKTFMWNSKDKMTLLTALEQSGGLGKNADRHRGVLRKGYLLHPNETRDIPFDIDKVAKGAQPNWEIEPGDAVIVLPKVKTKPWINQMLPLLFRFLPFGL